MKQTLCFSVLSSQAHPRALGSQMGHAVPCNNLCSLPHSYRYRLYEIQAVSWFSTEVMATESNLPAYVIIGALSRPPAGSLLITCMCPN